MTSHVTQTVSISSTNHSSRVHEGESLVKLFYSSVNLVAVSKKEIDQVFPSSESEVLLVISLSSSVRQTSTVFVSVLSGASYFAHKNKSCRHS